METNFIHNTKFLRFLGSGSFGIVFEAESETGHNVALKLWSLDKKHTEIVRDESKIEPPKEFNLMRDLKHKNLVQVKSWVHNSLTHSEWDTLIGFFDSSIVPEFFRTVKLKEEIETIALTMELCGNNLKTWLSLQTDMNLANAQLFQKQIGIVQDIVDGMKFLHLSKIIHRDLKPANIMFATGYEFPIKIGDFGLCRKLHPEDNDPTKTLTSNTGTKLYRPPEQNTNNYSFPVDQYSMGLVIWEVMEVLTGEQRSSQFYHLVFDGKHDLVKQHPIFRNVQEVVVKLTMLKPEHRFESMQSVVLDIVQQEPESQSEPTDSVPPEEELLPQKSEDNLFDAEFPVEVNRVSSLDTDGVVDLHQQKRNAVSILFEKLGACKDDTTRSKIYESIQRIESCLVVEQIEYLLNSVF